MHKSVFISTVLLFTGMFSKAQTTLLSVTEAGNTTSNTIQITGAGKVPGSGAGLELFRLSTSGVIQAYDRGASAPNMLRLQPNVGSITAINDQGGRLLVNGTTDDGSTALQVVNGGIKTTGAGYRGLSVNITNGYGTIDLNHNGARRVYMGFNSSSADNSYGSFGVVDDAGVERAIYIQRSTGNVGVGITTPGSKMDIRSSLPDGLRVSTGDNQYVGYFTWDNGVIKLGAAGYGSAALSLQTGGEERIKIMGEGNVGIGTASPGEKLAVNGNIRCKKLIVTQTGWADYVFDSAYVLQPLTSVEKHINEEKRLPGMPAAADIAKDGLEIGEMMKLQQAKIEELTLYLIQLKKDNEQLMSRVQQLESNSKIR